MTEKELFCTLGVGLGATAEQLLTLTAEELQAGYASRPVGPLQIRRTYNLPQEVIDAIAGRTGELFDTIPEGVETTDFLPLTMKLYYEATGDLVYPAHIMQLKDEEEARKVMGC